MKVLGIDPGRKGALAQLDTDTNALYVYCIEAVKASQGRGQEIVWNNLADQFEFAFAGADHCFLEKVGAMPKQGSSSNFKFGMAYGGLRALVAAHRIPLTTVTPASWKMTMGVTSDKKGSVNRALELFPEQSDLFVGPRGGELDGPAEAALLAYYGWMKLKENK